MTTYYFAAETGSDGGAGTTVSPYQSRSLALSLLLAGNEVLWKCGERSSFSAGATGWAITGKVLTSVGKIGYWGDVESDLKPLFDGGTYWTASDDANWTHSGGGVWTRSVSGLISRVFAGTTAAMVLDGSWGQPMAIQSVPAAELKYTSSASVLTIYTGSASVAPPSFYNGLCVIGNGVATSEGIHLLRCQNVTLDSIRAAHCPNPIRVGCQGTNDSNNILLLDCEGHAPARSGSACQVYHLSPTQTAFFTKNTNLVRFIADNHSSSSEDDDNSGNWGSNNGINFSGQLLGVTCVDPIVKGGFRHTYIQFQSDGTTTRLVGRGLHVYRSRKDMGILYCGDSEYGHPFDGDFTGYVISGLDIRDPITRSQFAGTGRIQGLTFTGCRQSLQTSNTNTSQMLWFQNWNNPDYRSVDDITVESCTIINPYHAPIAMLEDCDAKTQAPWTSGALKFYNNLIVDLAPGGGRTYSVDHQVQDLPHLCSTDIFKNNVFITTSTTPIRHEESAGVFTSRDVNTTAGSYNAATNLRAATVNAAGLTPEYRPVSGGACDGTGTHSGYRHDKDGIMFNNPPPKGAREKL